MEKKKTTEADAKRRLTKEQLEAIKGGVISDDSGFPHGPVLYTAPPGLK